MFLVLSVKKISILLYHFGAEKTTKKNKIIVFHKKAMIFL